jgi:nanoRNase/pAp phosphatase (c-di-AMP/oligoRNAs hydrolase)
MKTLIIGHNDLDGLFSSVGFIDCDAKLYENYTIKKNIEDYDILILGINIDFFKRLDFLGYDINNYDRLVMVDYSLNIEDMKKLKEKFKENFIWIDHHEAAYLKINDQVDIKGLRDKNNSAATLVYKYFNKEPPLISKYVEDIDIWKFDLENTEEILNSVEYFLKKTINSAVLDFNLIDINKVILFLDNDYFLEQKEKLIETGKIINNTIKQITKESLLNSNKYMFEGYRTLVINSTIRASIFSLIVFNTSMYKDIDQIIVWSKNYKTNDYKFSIRSRENDCNVIARKYGGNGHKQASGFKLVDLKEFENKLQKI